MEESQAEFNAAVLLETVQMRMPFGKYKNTVLANLPISYLEYFVRNGGFPKGKLGMLLSTVYEIKLNGLDDIFVQLRKQINNPS